MIVLPLFLLALIWDSQNTYVIEIHNELCHINLYMIIGISNWHIWSIDPTKMKFLTSFQFDTRLLTSKHLQNFSAYLVERNGAMLKSCFTDHQNAKKLHQLKHKKHLRYWSLFVLGFRVWKVILVIRGWAQKSKCYINFNKI